MYETSFGSGHGISCAAISLALEFEIYCANGEFTFRFACQLNLMLWF